jgi:hypothetical protein
VETEIKTEKAKAVMSLVNTMVDAYLSGFTPYPYLTLQQLHRVAQNHCRDNYSFNPRGFDDLFGKDLFNECRAISSQWDKLQNEIESTSQMNSALADEALNFECIANQQKTRAEALEDRLASMAAEFERIASLCAFSEAEFLIHGVLSQFKSEDQNLVVLRNMPKLPTGWKYSNAYRQPQDGEYYLFMGEIKFCKGRTAGWYHIVVRSEG